MTFIWINNPFINETCCWSVTNAMIVEMNNDDQVGEIPLGDMCISGISYECIDTTIWLCSESSMSGTPPIAELRSNTFNLVESVNITVDSNCTTTNNTQ